MPIRMIDGEAVWTSQKLIKIPEEYRLHYANWLPMAEANGVFEADPNIIWRKIYSYLLPSFSVADVVKLMNTFLLAGLVFVWEENGKAWGYFNGIDKPGRLPSEKHLSRYKNLPPNPPPGLSRNMPGGFGLDWYGMDRGTPGQILNSTKNGIQENGDSEMERLNKFQRKIWSISLETLGLDPERWAESWNRINMLKDTFGEDEVIKAFTEWAGNNAGREIKFPVGAFCDVAPGLIRGIIQTSVNPDLPVLNASLTEVGGQPFVRKAYEGLAGLLKKWPAKDIEAAYQEFLLTRMEVTQHTPLDFIEGGAEAILLARIERKKEVERQEKLMVEQRAKLAAAAQLQETEEVKKKNKEYKAWEELDRDLKGKG